jgi:hypothetical protein
VSAARRRAARGLRLDAGDDQLVGPEDARGRVVGAQGDPEHLEHGPVEPPAGGQILHHQLDVIDEAPSSTGKIASDRLSPRCQPSAVGRITAGKRRQSGNKMWS